MILNQRKKETDFNTNFDLKNQITTYTFVPIKQNKKYEVLINA